MKKVFSSLALAASFAACLNFVSCTKCDDTAKAAADLATKNKAVCQLTVDALNTGKLELLDSAFATDFVEHTPDPMIETTGIAALKEGYNMMRTAYPDVKIVVMNTVAEGDKVIIHQTFTGTNSGPMGPVPPTGKPVKADGVDVFTVKNGKITEHWAVYDSYTMMTQLGMEMVPVAGDSAAAVPADEHAGHGH